MKTRVLYSSADIHAGIKSLFARPDLHDRRVALVAYIGTDGESYLPDARDLHVICNPSPGTDPETLRKLMKRGAKVEVSDKLHMKVYWSRKRGCIVTSANASSSALGVSSLKEAGIWLPPGAVKIDRLIRYAQARSLTPAELHKLDAQFRKHQKNVGHGKRPKVQPRDFLSWYASVHRSKWKLGWCDDQVDGTAVAAKRQSLSMYGQQEPFGWIAVGKNRASPNDWLLSFTFTKQGVKHVKWMFADFVVKITPREKRYYYRDYPYHAVQVYRLSRYPVPPFKITAAFCSALRRAISRYSAERITEAKTYIPKEQLLRYIAQGMGHK